METHIDKQQILLGKEPSKVKIRSPRRPFVLFLASLVGCLMLRLKDLVLLGYWGDKDTWLTPLVLEKICGRIEPCMHLNSYTTTLVQQKIDFL